MKNITVGINDELIERMDQLKDVNWSSVTREAIEGYIRMRTSGTMEAAIGKVKAKKTADFTAGFKFITDNIDTIDLAAIQQLTEPDPIDFEDRLYELLNQEMVNKLFNWDMDGDNVIDIRFTVSRQFVLGMRSAASEMMERSR